jgi:hypothetical protein
MLISTLGNFPSLFCNQFLCLKNHLHTSYNAKKKLKHSALEQVAYHVYNQISNWQKWHVL